MRVDAAVGVRRYRRDPLDGGLDMHSISLATPPSIFAVRSRIVGTISWRHIVVDIIDV